MNVCVWTATNYQLTQSADPALALALSIALAIPISLLAFYGTRYGYDAMGSAWGVRLSAFAVSYTVFPFLTFFFLGESPFDLKTMVCIALSFVIVGIQAFWPNS